MPQLVEIGKLLSIFAGKAAPGGIGVGREVPMTDSFTFNPGFMTDAQSIATFIVRVSEFQKIIATFEGNSSGAAERFLLLGPRGAGKTTMCRRVLAEMRTNLFLQKRWEPIFLSEESYTVTTPGELLLECIFQLAQRPSPSIDTVRYNEVRAIDEEEELQEACLDFFRSEVERTGKRFLIIVENLHMIMQDQLSGDPDDLIAIISDDRIFGVLATAVEQSADEDSTAVPDGFVAIPLRPLTLDECHALWKGLTGLDVDRTRIRPLQILTGGSPRLIHILAEFMQTPSLGDLMGNINRLIDQNTEYFKNQLDLLPSGERKVFVTLLDAWDPSTAKRIAENGRVKINLASAALNRLSDRGMVEKSPGPGRSILYHASERLFNIYYLMRRRTHPSDRVRALVAFMTQYYDQTELLDTTTKLAFEACNMEPSQRGDFHSLFDEIYKDLPEGARAEMLRRAPEDFLKSLRRDEFVQRFSTPPDVEEHGPPAKGSYRNILQEARAALSDGNYPEASELVDRAGRLKPSAIQPWILRALVGLFSGDHEASIAAASIAVEMKPEKMAAHSILGTALAAAGRDVEAEFALNRAIELDADAMRALIELAKLKSKKGDNEGAIELYRRADAISPLQDVDAAKYGRLLTQQRMLDEAEAALNAAIERIEDPRHTRRALAELLRDLDRNVEAATLLYESALAADEWARWADYASFLIDVETDGGRARSAITQALERGISSPFLFWQLARAEILDGASEEEVVEIARTCIRDHLDDPTAWMIAGQIYEMIDDQREAEETYRSAISEDKDPNGEMSFLLGRLLATMAGRESEAEAAFQIAVDKGERERCGPLKDLAELLVHRGDDTRAGHLVSEALEINKRCYCSLLLKGEIAIRNHDLASARRLLEEAIAVDPRGVTALTALARISAPDRASELIQQAYEVAPHHALVLLARGRLCQRSLAERLEDVEGAVETDPELAEAQLELAALYARNGDREGVADLLADALTAVKNRMELIPLFVESAIEISFRGMANVVEGVLSGPEGDVMEPLLIALQMERGEEPVVAKEVRDVALDILDRIRGYRGECGTLFA